MRKNIPKNENSEFKIVDNFPPVVNKFGRACFEKKLREYSSYSYCVSKKEINLYAVKRSNNKEPLPKPFRTLTSKLKCRIESTFGQLIEHFNIKRLRVNSIIALLTSLEIKFLCFNILTYISGTTAISSILNFN